MFHGLVQVRRNASLPREVVLLAVSALFFGVVNMVLVRSWARRTARWFWSVMREHCGSGLGGSVVVMRDCLTGRDRERRLEGRPADGFDWVQGRWINVLSKACCAAGSGLRRVSGDGCGV